jgi:c-di-GMP-binding flagellar brake protein YcgR
MPVDDDKECCMGMHGDISNQRRDYSRVDVSIPVEYRMVLQEEKINLQAKIVTDNTRSEHNHRSGAVYFDPILEEWLNILDAKLDTIIHLLKLRREGNSERHYKTVNISGGGMSFSVPEKVTIGEILEIKLMLTFQQPVTLMIYGEVVKSEYRDRGYLIAVHYIHMDDVVRDEIVRFVFEREREIIREARR